MKKKRGCCVEMFIVALIVVAVIGYCLWMLKSHRAEPAKTQSYDATFVEKDTDEETSSVYTKSDSNINDDNSIKEEQISDYIGQGSRDNERNTLIARTLRQWDEGNADSLINKQALEENGYEMNTDGLMQLCKDYAKRIDSENFAIVPYQYIDYHDHWYCNVKIVPVMICKNGETGYRYDKAVEDTYTFYADGSFVPYAVNNIRASMIGIHKIK